jgi:hypothetical protein
MMWQFFLPAESCPGRGEVHACDIMLRQYSSLKTKPNRSTPAMSVMIKKAALNSGVWKQAICGKAM